MIVKYTYGRSLRWLLAFILIGLILLPLWSLFSSAAEVDFLRIMLGRQFNKALWNSITVSSFSACLSLLIGGFLAWGYVRTTMPFKKFFGVLIVLPMLIPSISHGMGLITLFGGNGLLSGLLGIKGGIYGFWGIVVGSVLYSFPVAFLMIADILHYEDRTPYEAARTLGIPRVNRFRILTWPYMRAPLFNVFFAVFTMIVTDYGVPLTIGGKYLTLPVLMYQNVIGLMDFAQGSVVGAVLLIPAVVGFLIDLTQRESTSTFVRKAMLPSSRKSFRYVALSFFLLISICVLLPIISFAVIGFVKHYPVDMTLSAEHVIQACRMNAGNYLLNSLIIALATASIGTVLTTVSAYFASRVPGVASRLVHFLSIISLAVPGIVLGLGYVLFFNGTPVYGTLCILVMANLVHFFASPYLMMYNALNKINRSLESVGEVLGINRYRLLKDVFVPMTSGTQIEMFVYFFVNSMMTISAVAFLANVETKPIALMINQFEAQMMLESVGCISLFILAVNLMIKTLATFLQRNRGHNEA